MAATTPFRVGPWIVEPRAGEISRCEDPGDADGSSDEVRRLGPKVTAVLVCLAERAGQVVTKDQLIAHAWDGAPFTSDEALAAVLYELRKALDDDARSPRFIETLRGNGYRLIAPVEPLAEPLPGSDPSELSGPSKASSSVGHGARRRRLGLLAGLAVLAVIAIAVWRLGSLPGARSSRPGEIRSLAVLPVTTFTPGAPVSSSSADPLSTALTDMLTAELAQLCPQDVTPGITMRGRTASEIVGRWRLDQVADVLGVDAVVEGSVLRSGDRLWISLQLVETTTGRMLWNGSWDHEQGDELLVLREVALEAAREIRATLGEPPG